MYLLGYDIGSSSVKASLVNAETGKCEASSFSPEKEMTITALHPGWAEQNPATWWTHLKSATLKLFAFSGIKADAVAAIGISYQMHGLVCVDQNQHVLRPAIIWCDSRAVPYGEKAFKGLGREYCMSRLLNSPGNFTAAKLAWVKEQEPDVFAKIAKIMLPGEYIAMKLTGEICTTISGLSEGVFWDFKKQCVANDLLDFFGFSDSLLPSIVPLFSEQGRVTTPAAAELGLKAGIPVTYRAGDQLNNALSLNVFNPGEIASTAGTSGVVYGVSETVISDPDFRVNTFAHVNHSEKQNRFGILLCINGTGILNSWTKKMMTSSGVSYNEMNRLASEAPVGSAGISVLPFGNGAERVLMNKETGASIHGLQFNIHDHRYLFRAVQEGIVFSFKYGIDIMEKMGIKVKQIHAGKANMFLSPVFRQTLADITGAMIELYDTDGAIGAAKGAGIGASIYRSYGEAFSGTGKIGETNPAVENRDSCREAYDRWKNLLERQIVL